MNAKYCRHLLLIILFFSVIAFISTLPIFQNFSNWGHGDWDEHVFYCAVSRSAVLGHHQFPLWNPYHGGGNVLLANAQSKFLSPAFFLMLIFDVIKGLKIAIWLHLVIGMLGVYLLAWHYKIGIAARIISSFVFMLSSMFAVNIIAGMIWFLSVAYLPWAFLFYLRAFHDVRYTFLSGFFLALMFFDGSPYLLAITLLFLAMYSFILVYFRNFKGTRVTKILCLILIYMLCLGAIKFIPSIEFWYKYPRLINEYGGFSIQSLLYGLFSRDQTLSALDKFQENKPGFIFINGFNYNMDEYGMYVGITPFLLFLAGITGYHRRKEKRLFLSFLIFLWIAFGDRIPLGLWGIIHQIPIYSSMRVPTRFRVILMLILALFSGFGFQRIKDYIFGFVSNKILRRTFILCTIFVILADFLLVVFPVWKGAFPEPPLKIMKNDRFYQVKGDPETLDSLYIAFLRNVGIVNDMVQTVNLPINAMPVDSPDYKGEVYFLGAGGQARFTKWSPNKIVIAIKAQDEGYVVLNQNYYSGWRAKGKNRYKVESVKGLVAVKVPHYEKEITLYYLPLTFIIGAFVTMFTLLISAFFLFRSRQIKKAAYA